MTDTEDERDLAVGSLAEEASKLLGALDDWAREQTGGLGDTASGVSGHAAARDLDAHLATGSAECTVCPVCRAMHAVRQLSPEVTAHLTSAAASLVQAVGAILATAAPESSADRSSGTGGGGVEHVHIDDEADEWPGQEPT